MKPTRIVILGAGFGGVYAALRLEQQLPPDGSVEVTLVNRDNFFLFTPMLHEVAASDLDITHIVSPVRGLLRKTHFICGDVTGIDLDVRRVEIRHGTTEHRHALEYDHLVLALGSITNFYNLPGLQSHALTMKSLGDAIQIRNRLISHLVAAMTDQPPRPFRFSTIGQLAAIGRRSGVAKIFGLKCSGFIAWWLWRSIYLMKLPGLDRKVRVALDWTLDLIFSKDIVQFVTERAPTLSHETHGSADGALMAGAGMVSTARSGPRPVAAAASRAPVAHDGVGL